MRRVLAWDTSGRFGVLCALELDDANQIRLCHADLLDVDQRQHSEGLFVGLEQALVECGWNWKSLHAIGIGIGPGSFTGVRVGLTAARTFGQMLGLPLVPVSSLAVLVKKMRDQYSHAGSVVACVDACMGEVYLRREIKEGHLPPPDPVESVEKVSELESLVDLPVSGLWISQVRYEKLKPPAWTWADLGKPVSLEPQAEKLAWAGALAFEVARVFLEQGSRAPLEVHPSYLRAPDAELKLKARMAAST